MTGNSAGRKETGRLARADGAEIAYNRIAGRSPGVIFLPGFRSDMTGDKALALESYCLSRGHAFVRFDYTGHGGSSGAFTDGTIGDWAEDATFVLDQLTDGPQILVGSSMGGWVMLLAALARPNRVVGMLGIAAAPDFTEDLIWDTAPEAVRRALTDEGIYYEPSEYSDEPTPITMKLIEDGRKRLLLRTAMPLTCPVRLIHGMRDPDVPWPTAQRIAEALASDDVEITYVKAGDHRLSEPHDLKRLTRTLGALLDQHQPDRTGS